MPNSRTKSVKKVPETTNNITKAIINFLRYEGHSASRINTQGQYDTSLKRYRPSGSRNGFLDIAACIKDSDGVGRFVVIDIKKGNDRLRADQLSFIKEVVNAGGEAIEITKYNDFLIWYREFMAKI